MPIPVGEVELDPSVSRYLILIKRNQDKPKSYSLFALPDDEQSFPYGSFKMFNTTRFDVVCRFDEDNVLLKPYVTEIITPDEGSEPAFGIKIAFRAQDEPWQKLYSSRWEFQPDSRVLVLLAEEQRAGQKSSVVVKPIREIMQRTAQK